MYAHYNYVVTIVVIVDKLLLITHKLNNQYHTTLNCGQNCQQYHLNCNSYSHKQAIIVLNWYVGMYLPMSVGYLMICILPKRLLKLIRSAFLLSIGTRVKPYNTGNYWNILDVFIIDGTNIETLNFQRTGLGLDELGNTVNTSHYRDWCHRHCYHCHGPLARYVKLRVAHAPGIPGTFSPPPQVNYPDMHHGTCVKHVPWCMPGSLTGGFLWIRWWGKRSQHSRCMRNPQFYVSGKRPMQRSCRIFDIIE